MSARRAMPRWPIEISAAAMSVVPVGQLGAHGAAEVHGPVGALLAIEIVDLQHPARCVELGGNDRQDHDVDGLRRRLHRSRTHHTVH